MSLNLERIDLRNDVLMITNDDGSISCIPREGATENELALFKEFETTYPNGKPQPIIEPSTPQQTQEDYLLDLDYRLSLKELGV